MNEKIVIIGGSSGIGRAVAEAMAGLGADVIVASRSPDRLDLAERAVVSRFPGARIQTVVADISQEDDVQRLFKMAGPVDHVVLTAADAAGAYQRIKNFDLTAARNLIDTKLAGALLVAKHADVGGSLTFTSGIAACRPAVGGSVVAAVNGALESLAYALAIELVPVRVNVVSPGWTDTPIWDTIAGDSKAARLDAMAARLPAGRVGLPDDVARAVLALTGNPFITGTLLHVDGGQRLV
jgi:NAD(P)-dependent dehydrogenase (short-subunit alcohol dehydrogenase family)